MSSIMSTEVLSEINPPRHDFYQNPTHVILSIYIKGYGTPPQRDLVKVDYYTTAVDVVLPPVSGEDAPKRFTLGPLAGTLIPGECSERILGTKIELRLAKAEPITWSSLLASSSDERPETLATLPVPNSTSLDSAKPVNETFATSIVKTQQKSQKNWDKFVDDELEDKAEASDPNAGGDAALQKLFSSIYANADADTRRAMIKSFTESGGTTLSTDWSNVGKETVPVRPPEGMYEMKM